MVTGVGSSLIQEAHGLPVQRHELALKPNVSYLGDIVVPVTPVILEEKCDRCCSVPVSPVEWQFKNIGTDNWLRDLDGLCWREFRSC